MKKILLSILATFSVQSIFAATGAEQAKSLVMIVASVVILIFFSMRKKNKKDED